MKKTFDKQYFDPIEKSVSDYILKYQQYFSRIFELNGKLTLKERSKLHSDFYNAINFREINIYDAFFYQLQSMMKQGVNKFISELKQKRNENNFRLIVQKYLNQFVYIKELFYHLLQQPHLHDALSGLENNVEKDLKLIHENFIDQLNQNFNLNL